MKAIHHNYYLSGADCTTKDSLTKQKQMQALCNNLSGISE